MKIFLRMTVLGSLILGMPVAGRAALLSYWNFNNDSVAYTSTLGSFSTSAASYGEAYTQASNSTAGTLASNTANSTVFNGSAIKIDFSNFGTITSGTINGKVSPGYSTQNSTSGNAGYGVFSDSTVNRAGTDSTTGGSLLLLNTGGNAIGKYLTFSLSSAGYDTLSLSYAARLTSAVTASEVWTYSLDGTNFFTLTTISPAATGAFNTQTLNLSSLSSNALNNQSAFYLRMAYSSANTQGSSAFDNFQLTGIAAVPEPSTCALLGAGVLGLVWFRRKSVERIRA